MTQPAKKVRLIKKYPNRRLYDSTDSRYITLADIRQLVMNKADFVIVDKCSKEDITRAILLQVIAEQENGEPMMSQDFLSQVIRAYGGAMQHFVSGYLEHSLKMLSQQSSAQTRPDAQTRSNTDPLPDPVTAFTNLAQKNFEFWQSMQQQFFTAVTQTPTRKPEATEQHVAPEKSHKDCD